MGFENEGIERREIGSMNESGLMGVVCKILEAIINRYFQKVSEWMISAKLEGELIQVILYILLKA